MSAPPERAIPVAEGEPPVSPWWHVAEGWRDDWVRYDHAGQLRGLVQREPGGRWTAVAYGAGKAAPVQGAAQRLEDALLLVDVLLGWRGAA